jgi:hypothetical protein
MSLKKTFLKVKSSSPKALLSIVLIVIGSTLLIINRYPGILSNGVAWLETEGQRHSVSIGFMLLFGGLWMLSSSLKQLFTHQISFTRGPLVYSVEKGLFEQAVRQLWFEYFHRSDLRTYVSLHGRHVNITGETPGGWDNVDELCLFLSQSLFTYTGYWGDISLHTSPMTGRSSSISF